MLNKIEKYLIKHQMIKPNDKVIVGISGGADSTCLLLVLSKLQEKLKFTLHPIHINHNLRQEEALRDQEFTIQLCKDLGLSCQLESVNVAEMAKEQKKSTEEMGRDLRREILNKAATSYTESKIALGHHRDDNVETGLHNLMRGTGIKGLSGIHPQRGNIIRPLLGVSKAEIIEYLEAQNQSYCTDSSNNENHYTRNRIRNKILPDMAKEINSKAVEHINQSMNELLEISTYMDEKIKEAYKAYTIYTDRGIVIKKILFDEEPGIIVRGVIKEGISRVFGNHKNISRVHVEQVKELIQRQVGRSLHLPQNLMAYRSYEGVEIFLQEEKVERAKEMECIDLQIPGQTSLDKYGSVTTELIQVSEQKDFTENHYTKYFDYDIIKAKLCLGQAKKTDYLYINEKGNRQFFNKFVKNEKIPACDRSLVLCIKGNEEIFWVIGHRRAYTAKVTQETKTILKIQIGGQNNGR